MSSGGRFRDETLGKKKTKNENNKTEKKNAAEKGIPSSRPGTMTTLTYNLYGPRGVMTS